ncbi:Eco57I restriction-modification methylase domain-containing protein [Halorussus ruber]|uniref:Eco57I restriction-modification methylase domain-containing protein n=1 Tax=Halorussus ruber TaxID=1126238 RepID=UPI0010931156|nr:DNA methyltransferase [Halorussus ruber]
MTGQNQSITDVLQDFVSELDDITEVPQEIEDLLSERINLGDIDFDREPEDFIERTLIFPLIDATGLNRVSGRPSRSRTAGNKTEREAPDFRLDEENGVEVIGESKPPHNIEEAVSDLTQEYLRTIWWSNYGIATDGFQWIVYRADRAANDYQKVREINLIPLIRAVSISEGVIDGDPETEIEEGVNEFTEIFAPDNLLPILKQEAPKEFRDTRAKDVENFYNFYIELLFGESEEEDISYDTTLEEDIVAPDSATRQDKRLFAVTLVNRLLFVKFLEGEEEDDELAVLPHGFLRQRVKDYGSKSGNPLPGSLYKSVIEPLFNDLLDTRKEDRSEIHRGDWFDDVPYLNGGLFQPIVEDEEEYDVRNRTLRTVIEDLVEAGAVELESEEDTIDPAILGSVFERTINHLGSESGQQEEGAYYTPDDVTSMISEEVVESRIRDEISEAFANGLDKDQETSDVIEVWLKQRSLSRTLRDFGQRVELEIYEDYLPPSKDTGNVDFPVEVDFGDEDAIDEAMEAVRGIRVVDAACGSGHFLTTVMDDIVQVQEALLIGKNGGRDPTKKQVYDEKKTIALDSLFGVDINDIAVEIAKLRVWLKMVEDNGWKEKYGELPSIDLNIVAGNSLVGFPVTGSAGMQTQIGAVDDRVRRLKELRKQYKKVNGDLEDGENEGEDTEITRREILSLEEEIKEDRDERYLSSLTHTSKTSFGTSSELKKFLETVPEGNLQSTIEKIKVEKESGDHFNDETKKDLEDLGARVHSKSADFIPEKLIDEGSGVIEQEEKLVETVIQLLEDDYVASQVIRQPTSYDIEKIHGDPVHWDTEFPEVSLEDDSTPKVGEFSGFDIVVGNPPYGEDVLDEHGEIFIEPYETSGLPDVAAPFVERQLALLDEDNGSFGNIVKLGLFYDSGYEPFWNFLEDSINCRVACYPDRPKQVFEHADVRVGIITGFPSEDGSIQTSDLLPISDENRQEQFENIDYNPITGFMLRDGIGEDGDGGPYLPKIGPDIKHGILEKLRDSYDEKMVDRYQRGIDDTDDKYQVWRREGARYFINPMLEKLYDARENEPFWFETELEQKMTFITLQSTLYYAYWTTYGNQHHHNWPHIEAFPFPDQETLEENREEIMDKADRLWRGMSNLFSTDAIGRPDWTIRPLKPLLNEVDSLVGEIYGLDEEEIEWLQDYHTDLGEKAGRGAAPDDQIRNY